MCNPKVGFNLDSIEEILLFWKWVYWNKGISTKVFKSEFMSDIKDVMDVNNAIHNKGLREAEIKNLVSQVR